MKAFKLIVTLAAALMLLTGCDFFRSLLGKPTSEDIERMRLEAVENARRQRMQDSLDRLKAIELEKALAAKEKAGALDESAGRYHVILGSFKVEGNAEKMMDLLRKSGYTPRMIQFNNGFEAVSVAAFDDYREALKAMYEVMEFEFCPEDVWIYDINQNMHVKQ